jgi:hypothetical protein
LKSPEHEHIATLVVPDFHNFPRHRRRSGWTLAQRGSQSV